MIFDLETGLLGLLVLSPIILFLLKIIKGERHGLTEVLILLVCELSALYFGYAQLIEEKETQKMIKENYRGIIDINKEPFALNERDHDIHQAISFLDVGKYDAAKSTIKEKKKKEPNIHKELYSKAIKWKDIGENKFAESYLTLYIYLVEKDPNAHYELGNISKYTADDRSNEHAIKCYENAIQADKNFVPAYLALGEIYEDCNQLDKAEEYYKTAIKIAPDNNEAREKIANLYFFRKEYDKALPHFEKLKSNKRDNSDIYSNLAICYYEKNQPLEAMQNIEEALYADRYNQNFIKFKLKLLEENSELFSGYESKTENETAPEDSVDSDSILINEQKVDKIYKKEEPSARITILNASDVGNAANNLGFILRKEFNIRYSRRTHRQKMYQTIIYYNGSDFRTFALEIANRLPGKQRVGRITNKVFTQLKSVGIKSYCDIVVYIGNDCANVGSWAYQSSR